MDRAQDGENYLYHCMENGIKGGEHIEGLEEEEDQEGSSYKNNNANILRVHAVGATCGALEAIEYLTVNARRVQEEVLAAILIKNAGTEYLSKYQLLISHNRNNTNNRLHNYHHVYNAINGSTSTSSTYTGMSLNVRSSSYTDHQRADDHHDDHKSISSNGNSIIDHCNGIIRSAADDTDADDDEGMYSAMKAAFKKLVPVVTYEDVEPFIRRIANGDTSPILSNHPITEFLTSSGTSAGERKLMPTIPDELERKKFLYSLLMPVMNQYLPGLDKGKGLYFLFTKSETRTPGGVLARPVLTSYYKSRQFQDEENSYTSPTATILCPDAFQSMYCQMLCGLIQYSEVLRMGAVFASAFLRAIKFLEENWQELCDDIRKGCLSDKITDLPSRSAVMDLLLCPNPELADRIMSECSKKSWQGIIARLWPKTLYIEAVVTGTMSQYIPTLDYYSGGLPLVCTMYASSECYFGINLKPLSKPSDVSYTLLPNMGYFEFIPVERSNSNSEVDNFKPAAEKPGYEAEEEIVDLTDLEVGKEYELVVTTYAGLYRYKVGDVLRVTGFYNASPQFQFICRKNVILSIDADKTDEECLHHAVRHASKRLQTVAETNLVEYTSFSDTGTIPGHYVLFWELQTTKLIEPSLLEACCLSLEESLDSVYRQCRNCDRSIGPLEIRVVKSGTFDMLMDYCVSRGSSINQYKTPRCINSSSAVLELLNSRVTQRAFSPSCPFWVPQRKEWAVGQ